MRLNTYLLLILLLVIPYKAFAQENIVSYDKSSLPVLNEELRSNRQELRNLSSTVTAILPIDLTAEVSGVLPVANGGTGSATGLGLGTWGSASSSESAIQATADGFVVGWANSTVNDTAWSFVVYTDSSSSPSTAVQRWEIGGGAAVDVGDDVPFMFPVKKDDYYRISVTNGTVSHRIIPLN